MARKLKPYKVDRAVDYKSGVSVDIMLDRETKLFFGELDGKRYTYPTAEECKRELTKLLKDYSALKWKPFIELEIHTHDKYSFHSKNLFGLDNEAFSGELSFRRLEGAKAIDGNWIQRPFKEDHIHQPIETWRRERDIYVIVPYSEDAWHTLKEIKRNLEKLMKRLEEFSRSQNFEKELKEYSTNYLLLDRN